MEKKSIEFKALKPIRKEFNEQEIIIESYIPIEIRKVLMKYYIESMFSDKQVDDRYYESELGLILGIIDFQTNIDIEKLSLDNIMASGLFDLIRSNIINYDDLKSEIYEVVELIKNEKSIGNTIDKLAFSITNFLGKLSEVDLSKEGISELLKAFDKQKNEYNKINDPSKYVEVPIAKTRKKKDIVQ